MRRSLRRFLSGSSGGGGDSVVVSKNKPEEPVHSASVDEDDLHAAATTAMLRRRATTPHRRKDRLKARWAPSLRASTRPCTCSCPGLCHARNAQKNGISCELYCEDAELVLVR